MKKTFLLLVCILLLNVSICSASSPADDNAMIAVALYIDTSGHYVPGIDLLNKALNEVIRFKINALFLGSEVHCGNEVLRDLNRYGIASTADASVDNLTQYAQTTHVNYVMLFTVHPVDISLDIKAFSAETETYIADRTITRPDGSDTMSTVETFSAMIGDQITQIYHAIRS
jgi:hypothetical protein